MYLSRSVQGGLAGKEHGFQIVTQKRTYMQFCDSPEELNEWMNVLRAVRGKSDAEIKLMMDSARVNPRNAEVI
jgi:hypothetical protein